MKIIAPDLVLHLTDAYTGERPHLPLELTPVPQAVRMVENTRGYHLLYYRRGGDPLNVTISLTSPYYQPQRLSVFLPHEGPLAIELWPERIYPFPRGATLLCGRVVKQGQPLAGALVTVKTLFEKIQTRTNAGGLFLLFPRKVDGERLIRRNRRLFLPGPRGGRRITLKIEISGQPPIKKHLRWPVGEEVETLVEA